MRVAVALGVVCLAALLHAQEARPAGNFIGTPRDMLSISELQHQAEQGDTEAMFQLAVAQETGRDTPQDLSAAVRWYTRAAHRGLPWAQNNLGVMHAAGRGVPQDDKEAVRWYRRAAAEGFAPAQNNLGFMYASGRGVAQDDGSALHW